MRRTVGALPLTPALSGVSRTVDAVFGFNRGVAVEEPMRFEASASAQATPIDAADVIAKIIVVALFTFMAMRLGADFLETGRLTGLLLLASETLVVALTVFRRSAASIDRSMRARVLTAMSMMGPPLVRPSMIAALAPEALTVTVSACGVLIVIAGKLSLGRSFGLMPANRGIVSTGLYRLVRHPIYMGYLVSHAAFVAANPTPWNLVLLATADTALLARAVCEEHTLGRDPVYREYQQLVRWRVMPGVF